MHKYNSQKLNGTGKVNLPATCGTAERSPSLSRISPSENRYWVSLPLCTPESIRRDEAISKQEICNKA